MQVLGQTLSVFAEQVIIGFGDGNNFGDGELFGATDLIGVLIITGVKVGTGFTVAIGKIGVGSLTVELHSG